MKSNLKALLKKMSLAGIEINYSLDHGISLCGLNVGRARHAYGERGAVALEYCKLLSPASVLDVGSGGGHQAAAFAANGARVTCVDYGTSIYAQEKIETAGVRVVHADFGNWAPDALYDLVWASHVLEHQRNPGLFIERLIQCCAPGGHVAIIVPFPHRRLWGGHVTLWTPGLLAYNVALCGVNLSSAKIAYGYRETWLVFQPEHIDLPELTYDSGDIDQLAPYLPKGFRENAEPWF